MELSKAKERLKDLIDTSEKGAINYPDDKELFMADKEALETALKALDNSISKDEVRKKIEECDKRRQELANGHFWENPSNINEDTVLVMAQTLYQELLGEE